MYDRDYVKTLERDLELDGSNRFEGWRFNTDKETETKSNNPELNNSDKKNS